MRKVLFFLLLQIPCFASFSQSISWKKLKANAATHLNLFAGLSLAKQTISADHFKSSFNYKLSDIDNSVYKPGYLIGARWDGKVRANHDYAISFALNRMASGTYYKNALSISPFMGDYTYYKAEDKMLNANISFLYKKMLFISDTSKFKWYVVGGPSMDIRISNLSEDNLANEKYRRIFLSGVLGLEFDNRSFYTLFIHYKRDLHSITLSPIQTSINRFELGMFVKASDLF